MGHREAVVEFPAWLDEVLQRWQEVIDDKSLEDLPYKIETNRSGQLVMSPAKLIHAHYQGSIAALLKEKLGGVVLTEGGIATPEGVKVPDVAWCSQAQFDKVRSAAAFAVAPEICVEIKSPSNARAELQVKVRLYLDAGAKEVWLVDKDGRVTFYNNSGPIEKSSYGVEVPQLG